MTPLRLFPRPTLIASANRLVRTAAFSLALVGLFASSAAAQSELIAAGDLDGSTELSERDLSFEYLGPRHVFVGYYNFPRGDQLSLEKALEETVFLTAINGSEEPAKVRIQTFDQAGTLLTESDRQLLPGESGDLIASVSDDVIDRTEAKQPASRLTILVSSDQPVVVFGNEQDRVWAGEYASAWMRDVPFHRVDCPEEGREWLCRAPYSVTSWDILLFAPGFP